MQSRIALLLIGLVLPFAGPLTFANSALPAVKDGDLIFQTSRSSQSLAIQKATGSPYSHMGMVFHRDGKPYVFEAIATVRFTPLQQWIVRGEGSRYVVKRLKSAGKDLGAAGVEKLRTAARRFEGRPYDLAFDWSDEKIYCSELVWKAYDRALGIKIGTLEKVRDFNLTDNAVRAKLRERYGTKVPLDAPVISPVSMFRSPLLTTVTER